MPRATRPSLPDSPEEPASPAPPDLAAAPPAERFALPLRLTVERAAALGPELLEVTATVTDARERHVMRTTCNVRVAEAAAALQTRVTHLAERLAAGGAETLAEDALSPTQLVGQTFFGRSPR